MSVAARLRRAGAAAVARRLRRHRRPLAAVALAVAAGVAVDAATADPPPGVPLVVAARDLPAGTRLDPTDLTTVQVPADAVPDGALARPADAAGTALASPLRRGEPVTDARLGGNALLTGAPAGTLAVPVPLADPAAVSLAGPGTEVAVLAGADLDALGAGAGEVLVSRALVLQVGGADGSGLLDGGSPEAVVVLALDREEATRVAGAVGRRPLLLGILP
jgi:Flp pilus assembly protein CpaB